MKTFTIVIQSEAKAKKVAELLITRSQWFAVTPLPDDEYEFEVRAENESLLDQAGKQ